MGTWFRIFQLIGLIQFYRIDELLIAKKWCWCLRPFLWLNPLFWVTSDIGQSRGENLCKVLEESGPIFVKFGQILSTRQDLFPDDIVEALAVLQDRVTPFPGHQAEKIVELALQDSIQQLFASFNRDCLASASVAQVHEATLLSGELVVVKIIRPHIGRQIKRDLKVLRLLARWLLRLQGKAQRYRPMAVIKEFERHLSLELDLIAEGANASQLARNFTGSDLLHVPKVYWDYTRKNVLVLEKVSGVKISHVNEMKAMGVDFKVLAENGVTIFFTQLLRDNFFHADMHPGNIFVDCRVPSKPCYMAVDFGIMGSLTREDQRYIAENLLAFFEQDYRRVAEMHVQSGWVPAGTSVENFTMSIRSVCEPIFKKPFKEISYAQLLSRLLQTAEQFNMEVQPQLLLLQKTLLNIEGLGRVLYPDLDLWTTAKPLLKKWMRQQRSPRKFIKQAVRQLPYWQDHLLELPDLWRASVQAQMVAQQLEKQKKLGLLKNHGCPAMVVALGLGGLVCLLGWSYGHHQALEALVLEHQKMLGWLGVLGCTSAMLLARKHYVRVD